MKPDDYQLSDYIYENPNEYNNYIVNTYIYVEYVLQNLRYLVKLLRLQI